MALARVASMTMGVWFLSQFIVNYMAGYLGTCWGKMPHAQLFGLMTAIGVVAGFTRCLLSRPMNRVVDALENVVGSPGST